MIIMSANGSRQFFFKETSFFPFQGRLSSGKSITSTSRVLSSLFSGLIQAKRYVLAIPQFQCRTEVNIQGMPLKRSVLKRWSVAAPHLWDVNFLSAPSWFYIRRLTQRGKKSWSEVDFCFSRFSPLLANLVPSHLWLRNSKKKKQTSFFYYISFGFYS